MRKGERNTASLCLPEETKQVSGETNPHQRCVSKAVPYRYRSLAVGCVYGVPPEGPKHPGEGCGYSGGFPRQEQRGPGAPTIF